MTKVNFAVSAMSSGQLLDKLNTKFLLSSLNWFNKIGGEEEDIKYLINDELHKCIRAAKDIQNKSYNSEVELVSELLRVD